MSVSKWSYLALGVWMAAGLAIAVAPAHAQPPLRVDGLYPRQLPRGAVTTVALAIPTLDAIESVEIVPAAGVTVSGPTRGEEFQGTNRWWTLTVGVGADAEPGGRALHVRLPGGRTVSAGVLVPSRSPRIAGLRLANVAAPTPPRVDIEFTTPSTPAELGPAPYVWFMVACDETPLPGVVRGTVAPGNPAVVRARIPRQLPGHALGAAVAACEVRVRLTDAAGTESNTLSGRLEVGQ